MIRPEKAVRHRLIAGNESVAAGRLRLDDAPVRLSSCHQLAEGSRSEVTPFRVAGNLVI
jgi:hypothetical protein